MLSYRRVSLIFIRLTLFFSFFGFFMLSMISTYGMQTGIHLTMLCWSTLVLCLPFFGGGILFYPLAPIIGILPDYGWELIAWFTSIGLNAVTLWRFQELYVKTSITHFLGWCLANPWPYWLIFGTAFLPVIAALLYHRYSIPARALWYYHIRLGLIILALFTAGVIALRDLIIISNIHG